MIKAICDFPYKVIEIERIKNNDFSDLNLIKDAKIGDEIEISINIKSNPRHLSEFGGKVKEIKQQDNGDTIRKTFILE